MKNCMLKVDPGLPYGRYTTRSNQINRDRLEFFSKHKCRVRGL
jgi:hypothetical protein